MILQAEHVVIIRAVKIIQAEYVVLTARAERSSESEEAIILTGKMES